MSPRSQQRVDRRRRALVDEVRNDAEVARPRIYRGDATGPTQRYNRAALEAINAPIAKYIPLRSYSLVIWFLSGLVPILGLLLLDSYSWQLVGTLGEDAARAFTLSEPGNLMTWLSSITFGFAVAVMLGTYSVRRHRRDDYRGNFTVWRWAILAAVLVSVDATTGLHNGFQRVCELVTRTSLWGDGSIWWVGACTILFGGMLIRLMFEMASSRAAVGWACAAICSYAWSTTVELGLSPSSISSYTADTSKLAAMMLGHHFVLFSLINYAREVVLEAMGLVDSPAVRRAKTEAAKAEKLALKAAAKAETDENKEVATNTSDAARKVAPPQKPSKPTRRRKSPTKPAPEEVATAPVEDEVTESSSRPRLRAVAPPHESEPEATSEFEEYADEYRDPDTENELQSHTQPELTVHGSDELDEERKLSKAERRRLRKEQRRKKRAA